MSNWNQPPPGFIVPNGPSQQPTAPGYPPYSSAQPQHPATGYPPVHYGHQQPAPLQPVPLINQPGNLVSGDPHSAWGLYSDYLRHASSFNVKQKIELLEALVGWETGNKYTVVDQAGNKMFYVGEEPNCFARQFCGSRRPVQLSVKDRSGTNVIMMDRPLDCSCCFNLFCRDQITVSTPDGQLLGSVLEKFGIFFPRYSVKDARGKTVLYIEGPLCPASCGRCYGNVVFKVLNTKRIVVGSISKQWSGFVQEIFTDADNFSMTFPVDLEPAVKAVCLAALFLIDYEYFEKSAKLSFM